MSETIITDSPSTGKTIPIFKDNISASQNPGTIIYEARDFLVPLREEGEGVNVIETTEGEERQLVDGEAMFITPITISNAIDVAHYVWLTVVYGGTSYEYVSSVFIPGKDTAQIGINGFSLVKNSPADRGIDAPGPMLSIYGRREDDLDNQNNQPLALTVVTVVSEQENGSHAPSFQGIF